MRLKFKQKKVIIGIVIIFTGILLLICFKAKDKNIKDFIKNSDKLNVSEILSLEKADEETYVLFFANEEGGASCAVIEENWLFYDILKISSQLQLQSKYPYTVMRSVYTKDDEEYQIIWGVLYRNDVKDVTVNGREAEVVLTEYTISLFYLIEKYEDKLPEMYTVLMN